MPTLEPQVEQYARAWAKGPNEIEVSLGLEYSDGESASDFAAVLRELALDALNVGGDTQRMSRFLRDIISTRWLNRAYFIEVDDGKCGVQVYMPYGMPKYGRRS